METGEVDLSNVVMSHGRGFVQPNIKCFLCGNSGGLKIKCDHEGCRVTDGDKQLPTSFHATCARQAGLEVNSEEIGRKTHFYGKLQGRIDVNSRLFQNRSHLLLLDPFIKENAIGTEAMSSICALGLKICWK
jgi:hypothetical protein